MSAQSSANGEPFFFWSDTEFTGSSVDQGHVVLEVAGVVTDIALNELDSYQSFVHQDERDVQQLLTKNPFWLSHQALAKTLLTGIAEAPTAFEVDTDLTSLADAYFPEGGVLLAGNSIHNDWLHICAAFPSFTQRLHYRLFDLSSVADFLAIYQDTEYVGKRRPHRALADVHESLDQARFLLRALGIDPSEVIGIGSEFKN
jgi:oligoribonuclease (3'-5' exoribonuclease)